jgi:uncharacterized membrane protein YoaK (UPF0700 family)
MIFKMFRIYRMAKRGVADPTGLVGEEIMDAYIGAAIVPALILTAVLVLLGILGYSHVITDPSLVARIIFWIFFCCGIVYASIAIVLGKLLGNIIEKGKQFAKSNIEKHL